MIASKWLHAAASLVTRRRKTGDDAGQEILRQRLSGDDSFWWILAGGVYVAGFSASGDENNAGRTV